MQQHGRVPRTALRTVTRAWIAALLLAALAACASPAAHDSHLYTLTVNRDGNGDGTVTSSPAGINLSTSQTQDSGPFPHGEEITLTANPADDSTFAGWTGVACDGSNNSTICTFTITANTTITANFDDPLFLPSLENLPQGVWSRVELSAAPGCADGSAYEIQVRPGSRDDLLLVFQGGGATWGELDVPVSLRLTLASLGTQLYLPTVTTVGTRGLAGPPAGSALDGTTQVVVSYCSGDVHWGDARGVDDRGRPIEQRGAPNAAEALRWLETQGLAPARVGVVGCSAGAYGALLWAPSVQALYPAAHRSLLLDAGLGVVQDPFLVRGATPPRGIEAWRIEGAYAANGLRQLLDEPLGEDYLERLVAAVAGVFDGPIGIASTDRDVVQTLFWYLMGEDFEDYPTTIEAIAAFAGERIDAWSALALPRLERLDDVDGVVTFVSDWTPDVLPTSVAEVGTGHCLTTEAELWDGPVGGAFLAWWAALRGDGGAPYSADLRED